jgi:hypothetical protein
LPVFRFSRAFGVGRDAKAFLNMHGGLTRGVVPDPGQQHEEQVESLTKAVTIQRKALQSKGRQIEEQAAKLEGLQKIRQRERKLRRGLKRQRMENVRLKNELEATRKL